jgi:His-Xaa-Ser system radical SAM maturase HxsC
MTDLFLLSKCNNRCINCVGSPDNKEYNNLDYYKSIASKLKQTKIICLGGGEPTIHREFFEIMEYLSNLNEKTEIMLLTNARAFSNESFLRKFNALKIDKKRLRIASAVYGPDSKVHDAMSRTPGSFEETVKGIKKLIKSGYKIEIRVIITKLNYEKLKETAEFIADEFKGIERVAFISMKFTWEAHKNRKVLLVPYKDVVEELIPAIDILEKNKIMAVLFHFPHCVLPEAYRRCSHGRTVDEKELHFKKECEECRYFSDCSGMWKSYVDIVGENEINLKEDQKNV